MNYDPRVRTKKVDHMTAASTVKNSVRALLSGAVDYAGLFPPAGLSMSEAVINYATYRGSNYSWMLGRFIVASARLPEFYESARELAPRDADNSWRISVVVGEGVIEAIHAIKDFNAASGPGIVCDTIEIKPETAGDIENAAASLPGEVTAYFEVPLDDRMPDLIATLALSGQRAKIRTGGVTPEAFPKSIEIIRFVRTCLAANVRFKATAGLHHPFRQQRDEHLGGRRLAVGARDHDHPARERADARGLGEPARAGARRIRRSLR